MVRCKKGLLVLIAAAGLARAAEPTATAVEFYNTVLGHYFVTAGPGEAAAIDAGRAGPGWTRTGGQFGVSRGSERASTLVTWFDTHQGRYLMVSQGAWLSISPADNRRIEHRLAEVLSKLD